MDRDQKLSYKELSKLKTFEERFDYLMNNKKFGDRTFGSNRYLNQSFYKSRKWKDTRRKVILRDNGCDLGIEGLPLAKNNIIIHHINSITEDDILNDRPCLYDLDNLITTSRDITHNAIEYGDKKAVETKIKPEVTRYKDDQSPWKIDNLRR